MGYSPTVAQQLHSGQRHPAPTLSPQLRHKIARRLLPYLFFLYIVAFLDRANVSYAALELAHRPGFSPEVLGIGMGIFFWGYFILEIPSALMVERWSARGWLSRLMITWGLVAMATAWVHTPHQFYLLRFLLGLAEAGFFPGILVYLGHWFTKEDKAKAAGTFLASVPCAFVIGGPLSSLILRIHWLGWQSWRWLFILEGVPAVLLGLVNLWYLPDSPSEAKWLRPEEAEEVKAALQAENTVRVSTLPWWKYLVHPLVARLMLAYFLSVCASYGFGLWLPTMIHQHLPRQSSRSALLSSLPYIFAMGALLFAGWSSDRQQERRWHTAVPMFITSAGFLITVAWGASSLLWALTGFCVTGIGVYASMPPLWALPAEALTGPAAAVALGMINSVGNLGGYAGPSIMGVLRARWNSFEAGLITLAVFSISAGLIVLSVPRREPDVSARQR